MLEFEKCHAFFVKHILLINKIKQSDVTGSIAGSVSVSESTISIFLVNIVIIAIH